MKDPSKQILIVGPSWIGDMIMAQSLFKKLKQQDEIKITVLAPQWTQPILKRMPQVKHTVVMNVGHVKFDLKSRWRLSVQLKENAFNQAIVLPGSMKSALIPWMAKIPKRTGYLGEMRYGLLNDIYQLNKELLPTTVQRFVNLAGTTPRLQDCPRPVLIHDTKKALEVALKFDYKHNIPLLILCPGAEYGSAKRWPIRRFVELAKMRHKQGCQVWLMGSKNDNEICSSINQLTNHKCKNLAGHITLTQAIDIISLANAIVTNDSGLMHLAAALDRPLVSIYGSSSPTMTPPLSDNAQIVWLQLDCGPCFKRDCPLGHLRCLNDISVHQVDDAINRLIN